MVKSSLSGSRKRPSVINPKFVIVTFESITANSAGGIGKLSYGLCTYLHKANREIIFYTINKGPHTTAFPSKSVHWSSRYFLFVLNLVLKAGLLGKVEKRKAEEWFFDFFLSRILKGGDFLITTSAFIPKTLKKNAKKFKSVIYIPPTPNELEIYEICRDELRQWGADANYRDAYTDAGRLQNIRCTLPYISRIISHSLISSKSFQATGIPITQVPFIYIPPMGSKEAYAVRAEKGQKIKVLYIAYSVLLKGLHRLLDEWNLAGIAHAELHIVGPVDQAYMQAFKMDFSKIPGVVYHGYQQDAAPFYKEAHLVVIPSLIDGEPHIATEALSYGKPVLISKGCGYSYFIGHIVPYAVFDILKRGELSGRLQQVIGNLPACQEDFKKVRAYLESVKMDYESLYRQIEAAARVIS